MARRKRTGPWLDTRNGLFYAFWYDDGERTTKRISLRTADAAEAQDRFAAFLTEGKEIRKSRSGEMTVQQALADYLTEHVAKKCAAADRQELAARNLLAYFGKKTLDSVTVPVSQDYAVHRTTGPRPVEGATVRRELNVLVAAANHARWMKRTKAEVSVDLPPERRLGPDDEAPYYTEAELGKIFLEAKNEPNEEIYHFINLLYYTAARRRSIEHLSRDQIRKSQRRIVLQKAGKVATRKRQPIVPIFEAMEETVDWLLARERPTRLFAHGDFYRRYVAICERAGIDETRQHPHIMRHTRATHLLQKGKSIYNVAKLLGDTIATVERVYGHHSADHLVNELED